MMNEGTIIDAQSPSDDGDGDDVCCVDRSPAQADAVRELFVWGDVVAGQPC